MIKFLLRHNELLQPPQSTTSMKTRRARAATSWTEQFSGLD